MDPSEEKVKDFKSTIKALTKKTCTFSHEKWCKILNPIIRGKANYMVLPIKAMRAVDKAVMERLNRHCKCKAISLNMLSSIDGYIRQRLRIAFEHKHPKQRNGYLNTFKYSNLFFAKMGLVSGEHIASQANGLMLSVIDYALYKYEQNRKYSHRRIKRLENKGVKYYTKERLAAIQACKSRA